MKKDIQKKTDFKKHLTRGFFLILVLIVINTNIFSQEEKNIDNNKENKLSEKIHQFGFTIKRANYAYYPVEYENDSIGKTLLGLWDRPGLRSQSELFSAANPKKLSPMRNNEQVINPFSLLYYNKNLNLNFEFSRYSLVLDSPYYVADLFGSSITPHDIGNIRRSENKLNVYSNIKLNESNSFFYGLGARNIKKENYRRTYITQDSILDNTYGINLFLKYQYKIISNLSINFSIEPFYTYGARNIKRDIIQPYGSPIPSANDFRATYNDPHAKIY
ncbi:MAG TPA: hypothetical protein PLL86_23925, partial [Leptospiraceae bacterium]|nr:hypothetical protein [Leptospiraceae bacterium]